MRTANYGIAGNQFKCPLGNDSAKVINYSSFHKSYQYFFTSFVNYLICNYLKSLKKSEIHVLIFQFFRDIPNLFSSDLSIFTKF